MGVTRPTDLKGNYFSKKNVKQLTLKKDVSSNVFSSSTGLGGSVEICTGGGFSFFAGFFLSFFTAGLLFFSSGLCFLTVSVLGFLGL